MRRNFGAACLTYPTATYLGRKVHCKIRAIPQLMNYLVEAPINGPTIKWA